VRRINVSLDTLDPAKFAAITRWGRSARCWTGSSRQGRRPRVKINAVALKGVNEDELRGLIELVRTAAAMDLT
jgi:cyclic pyranopterin phosphate synthase